jgi:excisionase family DNA binding protein
LVFSNFGYLSPVTRPARRASTGEPAWLTVGQAARYLGVAQSTIRKWSDQGRVPTFYTPGGHRRYRRDDLEAFLDRSGPGHRAGPLVLIVDDDLGVRELMRGSLEREGYTVREAASAADALEALDDRVPELVLLDVVMPGADGWQLLRWMQERHGSIPVIMFSGETEAPPVDAALERGARGFVGKPFDPQELIDRAKQLVPA